MLNIWSFETHMLSTIPSPSGSFSSPTFSACCFTRYGLECGLATGLAYFSVFKFNPPVMMGSVQYADVVPSCHHRNHYSEARRARLASEPPTYRGVRDPGMWGPVVWGGPVGDGPKGLPFVWYFPNTFGFLALKYAETDAFYAW